MINRVLILLRTFIVGLTNHSHYHGREGYITFLKKNKIGLEMYKEPGGNVYTIMLKLHNGVRKPQNDFERSLLAEMREIEASGGQIDFSECFD